uniref:Paired domain-containing protein n=1 Tax=Panagrellus redivivus TaxID=6233 RepID=A0A7E4V7E0_PANRE
MKQNQNGGLYVNGKSLPMEVRLEIVQRYIRKEKITKIAKDMKLTHGVVSKITQHFQKTGLITPKNVKSTNEKVSAPQPRELSSSAESLQSQSTSATTSTASTPNSTLPTNSAESVFPTSTFPRFPDNTLPLNMDASTFMAMAQLNLAMMTPMPNFLMQPMPILPSPQVQALQMQMNALVLNQLFINACQQVFRH